MSFRPCLPSLLHNSKMCHFDRREKSHVQLVHQSYTWDFSSLSVVEMTINHLSYRMSLPACRQVLHCHFEGVLERLPRLRGEIPCSTRAPKLYMGFLLPSVVEMTINHLSYRRIRRGGFKIASKYRLNKFPGICISL